MSAKKKYKGRQVLKSNNTAYGKRNWRKKFKAAPHPFKSVRSDDGQILPWPDKGWRHLFTAPAEILEPHKKKDS